MYPKDSTAQTLCPISLTLELGNTTAGLWLSEWPMTEQIRQFVPDGLLDQLPENLAISIIESALAPLLQQAEAGAWVKDRGSGNFCRCPQHALQHATGL